ncbi:MAG: hypothetical protein ABIH01_04440 [Candidatus Omnitrophota bacterium]
MRNMASAMVVVALVSVVAGIVSRISMQPFIFNLEANAFLRFADTCLLLAIALALVKGKD